LLPPTLSVLTQNVSLICPDPKRSTLRMFPSMLKRPANLSILLFLKSNIIKFQVSHNYAIRFAISPNILKNENTDRKQTFACFVKLFFQRAPRKVPSKDDIVRFFRRPYRR